MPYRYDIFLSYRRDPQTKVWINQHFIPLVRHYVALELGRDPVIYIDEQLEIGTTWPIALGHALGTSKVIIPLWSKMYLNSVWCACEISHMLEREVRTGFRTMENPNGLIFPVIIHDGETMPVAISSMQKFEIQDCFNVRMNADSAKAEILADKLKTIGAIIADGIINAPECQRDWMIESANDFFKQFYRQIAAQQVQPPRFT